MVSSCTPGSWAEQFRHHATIFALCDYIFDVATFEVPGRPWWVSPLVCVCEGVPAGTDVPSSH